MATITAANNTTEDSAFITTTIKLPESLWVAVRTRSVTERIPANQIVAEALAAYMADKAA